MLLEAGRDPKVRVWLDGIEVSALCVRAEVPEQAGVTAEGWVQLLTVTPQGEFQVVAGGGLQSACFQGQVCWLPTLSSVETKQAVAALGPAMHAWIAARGGECG